jgi:hypothetical protein
MGPIHCPQTSVKDYHSTLRYTAEERTSHQHRGGSVKSHLRQIFREPTNQPTNCTEEVPSCGAYSHFPGQTLHKLGTPKAASLEVLILIAPPEL